MLEFLVFQALAKCRLSWLQVQTSVLSPTVSTTVVISSSKQIFEWRDSRVVFGKEQLTLLFPVICKRFQKSVTVNVICVHSLELPSITGHIPDTHCIPVMNTASLINNYFDFFFFS